jgi:hypothetical protein
MGAAHSSAAGRSTRCHRPVDDEAVREALLLEHCQEPAPTGELAGHRDVGHGLSGLLQERVTASVRPPGWRFGVMLNSYSTGVNRPRAACLRRRW